MIIREETTMKWIDGTYLIRTYSDAGYYIEREGVKYTEAIDPAKFERLYTETDEKIPEEKGQEQE